MTEDQGSNGEALFDPNGLEFEAMPLWAGPAPEAVSAEMLDQPMFTVHRPEASRANGAAMIVNPGGGYRILASDHEGLQVARWLNRIGIAAFVLRYRVAPPYHSSISLLDGLRAVRLVRVHAQRFGIDSARIGMLGFSAGGHLTTAVGTGWDDGDPDADDPVERMSSRPDFLVPVYAVTNGAKRGRKADEYTPTDEMVNERTPPAFIMHTHGDTIVPATQSTLFYDALLRQGVNAELHIFNDGEHGLGLMPGDPDVSSWTDLLQRWLRRRGFLTSDERTALTGRLLVSGAPLGMVWITLLPRDSNHPIARVRINRASKGEFSIDKPAGPVPGWHRLQIHHVSEQYPHVATGVYTLADRRVHERDVEISSGMHLELHLEHSEFREVANADD